MAKLLLLFVAVACFSKLTTGFSTLTKDSDLVERCTMDDNGMHLVNGQKNPLASTMENFISLAEKLEYANPTITLKEELFYFIRNYTYENMEYTPLGDVSEWIHKDYDGQEISKLWERDDGLRLRWPDIKDPFTDDEKCSLFYSISYSVVRIARNLNIERAATNNTWRSEERVFEPKNYYPIEQGVLSIRGTDQSTALGRVLIGLYVGMNENRKKSISEFTGIPFFDSMDVTSVIDPLYTLTIAEVIALSTWRANSGSREKLSKDGRWRSVPIGNSLDTKDICPMLYSAPNGTQEAFSYNALRGAADGLILGKVIDSVKKAKDSVKLSQILRMYYSKGGLSGQTEEGGMWASFCNRAANLQALEEEITEQVKLYIALGSKRKDPYVSNSLSFAINYYKGIFAEVFGVFRGPNSDDLNLYCKEGISSNNPEELPLETKLDVIAVMDTSFDRTFFERQQLILGYLARQMDLSLYGSRMTIFTDERISTSFSTEGSVLLKPIVENTASASCASCYVTQVSYPEKSSSAPEDEVIFAIDQLLQRKKDNQTRLSGVSGQIILYFNFQEDEATARPTAMQSRIAQALQQLHSRHSDIRVYALGRNVEVLKTYSRGDPSFSINVMDAAENVVGKDIFKKISQAPSTLQFTDCIDGRGESSAILEDFVSPNAIQHWEMPAKYFYKSFNVKFTFDSQYGPIKVCHSRATLSPELIDKTCSSVTVGNKAEFKISNPCKSFTRDSCAPFYFSIIGVNETDSTSSRREYCSDSLNSDNKCKTIDQIKFKVMHEGIRCSGCLNLFASVFLIYLGVIITRWF